MPIVRGTHSFDDQFTQIPNAWLRDPRLSLKAIGLLAQLLSHSPGWNVSIAQLARANECGLDLIRNAVKELELAGYLVRTQKRIDNRFGEAIWETTDPVFVPSSGFPSSGFPSSGFPSSGNPTPKNKSIKKNIEKKDYADSFAEFWGIYPRRIGKGSAERAFAKAAGANNPAEIIDGARRFANDPNLPPAQYIPYPTTWLNREGWLDEPLPARERSSEDLAAERLLKAQNEREASKKWLAEQAELAKMAGPVPKCQHDKNPALCHSCLSMVAND